MKTNARWISLLLGLAPLWLHGQEVRSARIVAVTGDASVAGPGGTVAASIGSDVAVGSTITTLPGGSVTLKFFEGTVGIIQQKTTVTLGELSVGPDGTGVVKENTLLNLRTGEVVASLDPAKKDVNHFSVRTPQGVATAHGTVFAVEVSQDASNSNVTTMSGTVTYVTSAGTFTIPFGQAATGNGAVAALAAAAKADPNLIQDILSATASVAAAVGNGTVTNTSGSPALINSVLSAVVAAAVEVSPTSAPQIVANTISAAGPAIQGSGGGSTAVAIAAAAAQAETQVNPAGAAAVTTQINSAAATAAQSAGVTVAADAISAATTAASAPATSKGNAILPPLDQTQIVVSPSSQSSP
jgi:hypothetical protein